MRVRFSLIVILLSCCLLGACGIKPGTLEPPEHVEEDGFPHTYPPPDLNKG